MSLSLLEEHTPTVTLEDLDLTNPPLKKPELTRSSGKIKKKRKRKSSGPNAYAQWVQQKIQNDPDIKKLPAKQRFKRCGELWALEKAKKTSAA